MTNILSFSDNQIQFIKKVRSSLKVNQHPTLLLLGILQLKRIIKLTLLLVKINAVIVVIHKQ